MRTPKEVADSISPTMLKCIEGLHFDKRIYEWMAIYAKEYHQSEVLKLNKATVSGSLPLSELKGLLDHVSQLIRGWNATEAQWSKWDEKVFQDVYKLQLTIDKMEAVNFR